MDHGLG